MNNIILTLNQLMFKNFITYPDIQIQRYKTTFLTGYSGSGKSTLLKLINGTIPYSRGDILYEDLSISQIDSIELRKSILLIGQSVFLFDKSIKENFTEFYKYRELPLLSEENMLYYLKLCLAPSSLDMDCTTMSGGERQRIYIAIFLSFNPKVLMLDEPTSALDSETSHTLIKNLITYCKKNSITPIIISHDVNLTNEFADCNINLSNKGSKL